MSSSTVYTRRFFLGSIPAKAAVVVGTVPAGFVWVFRDMTIWQGASGPAGVQVVHQATGLAMLSLSSPSGSDYAHWEGRVVANAGEGVQIYVPGLTATVCLNGYQLGTATG